LNRQDYPAFVKKIWTDPGGHTERGLSIAGLGLIGECGEVCEVLLAGSTELHTKMLIDECGDVLYYVTVLADWKGYHIEDVWPNLKPGAEAKYMAGCMLVARAKEVSERVKKLIRDGKDPAPEEMRTWLRQVLFALDRILEGVGANLYDAMNENVRKLEVRYAHAL